MARINDLTTFPNTTPALADHIIGTDVSDTTNSADGETATFKFEDIIKTFNDVTSFSTLTISAADTYLVTDVLSVSQPSPTLSGTYQTIWEADMVPYTGSVRFNLSSNATHDGGGTGSTTLRIKVDGSIVASGLCVSTSSGGTPNSATASSDISFTVGQTVTVEANTTADVSASASVTSVTANDSYVFAPPIKRAGA